MGGLEQWEDWKALCGGEAGPKPSVAAVKKWPPALSVNLDEAGAKVNALFKCRGEFGARAATGV